MHPDEFAERLLKSVDLKWVRSPATADDILSVERRLGIRLSDELRTFYGSVGGTDEPTPPDEGWVTFWPLDRWERATTVMKDEDADLVLVADYSLGSWFYATRSSANGDTPILIVDGLRPARLVAPSFSAFAEAVFKDDSSIYPE